jgi:hypothetical protein
MDIHPWTKYEIARIRDEERLLRAREARRAKEVHGPTEPAEVGGDEVGQSFFGWLRRRRPVTDSRSVGARPA